MKGRKEIIGVIPKEKVFQAAKHATNQAYVPAFRCGRHGDVTPPRPAKIKPWEYDPETYYDEEVY